MSCAMLSVLDRREYLCLLLHECALQLRCGGAVLSHRRPGRSPRLWGASRTRRQLAFWVRAFHLDGIFCVCVLACSLLPHKRNIFSSHINHARCGARLACGRTAAWTSIISGDIRRSTRVSIGHRIATRRIKNGARRVTVPGMPQTVCSGTMFTTPSGFSPHLACAEPEEEEEAAQEGQGPAACLADGPPISSASLETLIQNLVPTADYYPEKAYVFTFLLSARLFIPPPELLARVCELCIKQQQLDQSPLDTAKVRKFGPKILQLLTEWTETFPSDFKDEKMVGLLKDIIHRIAPCDEAYWKTLNQVLQKLSQRLALMSQEEESVVKVSLNASHISDKLVAFKTKPPPIQKDMLSICNDPYTLAQQLTHVELEHLSHIGPEEFVQAFVQKDPLDGTRQQPCFSDQKKTSNLEAYVRWFNRLCYLVATEICMPAKKKQRALVIEFFIDVARECFNIGNFNSLMAIISGMNMSPVSRLKKTWGKAKTAKFFILEHQMDPTGNFYNYRTALRGAAHRSRTANSNREKIVIPFFSLLIKDIYFLNEGCANRLPNGHVNFEKFVELARQVGEFMIWKQVECPFEEDQAILHYLHTSPIFSEDGLYLASYESESPENQVEKDRWKALRSNVLGKT